MEQEYRIRASVEGWFVDGQYEKNGPWLAINEHPYPDANKAKKAMDFLSVNNLT